MLYIKLVDGHATAATADYPGTRSLFFNERYENRNDWATMARAEVVAGELSRATGVRYLATDAGPGCSPRFDVIAAPVAGALVSKSFNGDSYPEGEIVKVSATFRRVVTSTGAVFFRRGQSGRWVQGGTWALIPGHRYEQNPSF